MIDLIRRPIEKEFLLYQETYRKALEPDNPILSQVVQYLNGSLGKEIRPTILLLSSALFGPVGQTSIKIAASLQILHTA
ncbi:MAG: polyprenyl synthetase family protein, partial [Bacteroidales bacterium]|nr:polyprenyl synthetase family protein [Bacteroidales bacterium]